MKRAVEVHKGTVYTYDLFPALRTIVVDKGLDQTSYRLFRYGERWVCDAVLCAGSRFYGKCHHSTFANSARFITINEPWVEWTEEALKMELEKEKRLKKEVKKWT